MVPDKAQRRASHPPAASNGARAAALCLRRPESAYIALGRSCRSWDDCAEGQKQDRTVGRGSRARYCDFVPRRKVKSHVRLSNAMGTREEGAEGGTHGFLGGGIVLHGCADDPQRLHFYVVRWRGEQALKRLPHTELFEI